MGLPWAWVDSEPEVEARRMKPLRDVRDGAPRFRLLFPHPTPDVQRRLDDGLGLLEDWLVREGKLKHRAPRDIASAVTRTAEAVADLLPTDGWRVRLVGPCRPPRARRNLSLVLYRFGEELAKHRWCTAEARLVPGRTCTPRTP
ncbi:hypothetical protein OG607_44560 [Streptomyces sp. NBC_01537]|uniref:hypothetical protein n=1 Tax=Streptomyces sp. NBC_01537 TaxID=2903896 RepID=UPI003869EC77